MPIDCVSAKIQNGRCLRISCAFNHSLVSQRVLICFITGNSCSCLASLPLFLTFLHPQYFICQFSVSIFYCKTNNTMQRYCLKNCLSSTRWQSCAATHDHATRQLTKLLKNVTRVKYFMTKSRTLHLWNHPAAFCLHFLLTKEYLGDKIQELKLDLGLSTMADPT